MPVILSCIHQQVKKKVLSQLQRFWFGFICAGIGTVNSYKRHAWNGLSCLLKPYTDTAIWAQAKNKRTKNLSVSWQFSETYGVTSYGSGGWKDVKNLHSDFALSVLRTWYSHSTVENASKGNMCYNQAWSYDQSRHWKRYPTSLGTGRRIWSVLRALEDVSDHSRRWKTYLTSLEGAGRRIWPF